jgi:iron complex transport system substrate-binding protein
MQRTGPNILLLLLASLVLFPGCSNHSGLTTGKTQPVTDMLGRKVTVPEEINQVVGLRAGALRLLIYMDISGYITGIEDLELRPGPPYTMAHPELLKKPVIGPTMGGDAELIAAASPDIIFITYTTRSDADELQSRTSIPVVALNCGNFMDRRDTLYQSLQLIGNVMHKESRADSLISFFNRQIFLLDSLSGLDTASHRPEVYVGGIAYSGARGITSTDPFYPPFQLVNAHNVAGELDNRLISPVKGTSIDIEKLIQWNPEYIFIDAAGLEMVRSKNGLASSLENTLAASGKGQVFTLLPFNWYATNFENILVNAWFIGKTIYPDAFQSFDPMEQAGIIYRYVLGDDVLDQLKVHYDFFRQTGFGK